ncbi:hypothetical protein EJ05DRAFT_33712 [Pseudovirgaria hyperparasitica]|uniref:Protein kinase domain-containing protein n=1 Tax=Pseudovirgaria hyperparasitica TaxID=470096 RepID=A0A6A6WMC8_9PEZI|nr:uncharacterized protein EJ05DRAFT_33712 [Pseudovirgaria hyperparasitica]KAF2763308.1 hypothetical protein EJ05DRAFT_33712 [Pseudovirgaria hyperparasitica]
MSNEDQREPVPGDSKWLCLPRHRPDSKILEFPYAIGKCLEVQSHVAPEPLEAPYAGRRPDPPSGSHEMTQLEFCLASPPLEGYLGQETMSLTITGALAVSGTASLEESEVHEGTGPSDYGTIRRGAQILLVNNAMVAKIYDPLYYDAGDRGDRKDVTAIADRDYTREVAAYQELEPFWGALVPTYYGSWTFEIPTQTPTGILQRSVRLILIEHIQGRRLLDMNPHDLTEKARTNVMRKVIKVESVFNFNSGVSHRDIAPRNFICVGDDLEGPDLRIVVLDFNNSVVHRLELPISPVTRWPYIGNEFLGGWLPDEFDELQKWLWHQFATCQSYQPPPAGLIAQDLDEQNPEMQL